MTEMFLVAINCWNFLQSNITYRGGEWVGGVSRDGIVDWWVWHLGLVGVAYGTDGCGIRVSSGMLGKGINCSR